MYRSFTSSNENSNIGQYFPENRCRIEKEITIDISIDSRDNTDINDPHGLEPEYKVKIPDICRDIISVEIIDMDFIPYPTLTSVSSVHNFDEIKEVEGDKTLNVVQNVAAIQPVDKNIIITKGDDEKWRTADGKQVAGVKSGTEVVDLSHPGREYTQIVTDGTYWYYATKTDRYIFINIDGFERVETVNRKQLPFGKYFFDEEKNRSRQIKVFNPPKSSLGNQLHIKITRYDGSIYKLNRNHSFTLRIKCLRCIH